MNMLRKCLVAAAVLFTSTVASAGLITDWEGTGVNFTSSWMNGNTLRVEIDAGTRSGGWANAVTIDSIAISSSDWSWSNASDISLTAPGTFGGSINGTGLDAGGCKDYSTGKNHQCWSGLADLADDMYFDFLFSGDAVISSYTETAHLKVRFLDADGKKAGSLLSTDFVSVPEPSSLVLLSLGLLGLGYTRRSANR